ncbi:hypothetical protein B0H14DRAFT_3475164 [Mycena olivaceomarginata]|nr:hypothetical protein B0H14DRAFT_3475164 [Mycena olivaceomarginata]
MNAHPAYQISPPIPPFTSPLASATPYPPGHCRPPLPLPHSIPTHMPAPTTYALDLSTRATRCLPLPRSIPASCALVTRCPRPHLGPRYLHHVHVHPMTAAHSLRLRACFPPLPRSIPAPCMRSLAAALDLCCAHACYPPLPCLPPATYRFSARCLCSRFLPDALSLCIVNGPLVLSPAYACAARLPRLRPTVIFFLSLLRFPLLYVP